jgi:hypothetical protein
MAAIFADAAVFGFKGLSKGSISSVYDEKSIPLATELWDNLRSQVFKISTLSALFCLP